MHPSSTSGAPVAYSSTGDVSGTYWAGILGGSPCFGCMSPAIRRSRSCVRSGRRRSDFVVELRSRISSAAAN